jgi:hypothetical protein
MNTSFWIVFKADTIHINITVGLVVASLVPMVVAKRTVTFLVNLLMTAEALY